MGKSVKKEPIVKDKQKHKKGKKCASRLTRARYKEQLIREEDIATEGNAYKKLVSSWDLCDYIFRLTREEAIEDYYRYIKREEEEGVDYTIKKFPTVDDFINWWEKHYLRK